MSDAEYGVCDTCHKEGPLMRTYTHFPEIKCECCVGEHFEYVRHCPTCKPRKLVESKVIISTAKLQAIGALIQLHRSDYEQLVNTYSEGEK